MLSKDQKKKLRSLSHSEPTLVFIGKNGITDTVLESFEISLNTHGIFNFIGFLFWGKDVSMLQIKNISLPYYK